MANPTATVINTDASVTAGDEVFDNDIVTVTAPLTLLKGSILARDSSTLKLVPFVKGGSTNGNGIPKKILTHDLVVPGSGATDVRFRALSSGKVKRDKLVIIADGNATNVDAAVLDQLRAYGLVTLDAATQLNVQDN